MQQTWPWMARAIRWMQTAAGDEHHSTTEHINHWSGEGPRIPCTLTHSYQISAVCSLDRLAAQIVQSSHGFITYPLNSTHATKQLVLRCVDQM
jgi:hypothetical protein